MINHKSNIIVSICCVTYNHASFIRKALDGFLMQEPPSCMPEDAKLSDWCEILIHDDCSTDGTTEIVRGYAAKYPDVIFPLYEEVNQFTRGGKGRMDLYNYKRVRGRYIAYCEGDDYWTDPHKLQKQVDFMDGHPEYSICFHACRVYDTHSNTLYYEPNKTPANIVDGGVEVTSNMLLRREFGAQPLTMLMRTSMYQLEWFDMYRGYRDTHEIYNMLRQGKGYFMDFIGGVYIKHEGGISTSVSLDKSCEEVRECYKDLYLHNKDDQMLRNKVVEVLLWNYDVYKKENKQCFYHNMMFRLCSLMPGVVFSVYEKIMHRWLKRIQNIERV